MEIKLQLPDAVYASLLKGNTRIQGSIALVSPREGNFNAHHKRKNPPAREEQKIISEKSNSYAHIGKAVQEFEQNPEHELLQKNICPLEDDGKRVITNSIVRKWYRQRETTLECKQYVLWFVDQNGDAVSDHRLVDQKSVGERTETAFELAGVGGGTGGNCYLLIANFETGDIICAQKYKIKISFTNDFDF